MRLTVRSLLGQDFEKAKLVRVSSKHPCFVCRKSDWCATADDNSFALCMRVSAGSIKQAKNGAYIHILNSRSSYSEKLQTIIEVKKAGKGHIHRAYSYLIREHLSLNKRHFNHLNIDRGLSEETIKRNRYVSAPQDLFKISADMQKVFGDSLKGVPGFYKKNNNWQLVKTNGIWLPVRDHRSNIRGFQIKQDLGKPKYIWLSSLPDKYEEGTSSGSPLHFSNPHKNSEELLITEGILKADCISEFAERTVLSLAGVKTASPERVLNEIKLLPNIKWIIICYDSDWLLNSFVCEALISLGDVLAKDYHVFVRTWENEKGYDDLLLKDRKAKVINYLFEDFKYLYH